MSQMKGFWVGHFKTLPSQRQQQATQPTIGYITFVTAPAMPTASSSSTLIASTKWLLDKKSLLGQSVRTKLRPIQLRTVLLPGTLGGCALMLPLSSRLGTSALTAPYSAGPTQTKKEQVGPTHMRQHTLRVQNLKQNRTPSRPSSQAKTSSPHGQKPYLSTLAVGWYRPSRVLVPELN